MKHLIAYTLIIIVFSSLLIYKTHQYNEMVFNYEQELRVDHTLMMACEARLMYFEDLLRTNNIFFAG